MKTAKKIIKKMKPKIKIEDIIEDDIYKIDEYYY
jgi:hypothetical protein